MNANTQEGPFFIRILTEHLSKSRQPGLSTWQLCRLQTRLHRYPSKVSQALTRTLLNRNKIAEAIIAEFTIGIPHTSKPGNKDGLLSAMEKAKREVMNVQADYSAYISPQAIRKYNDYYVHVVNNYRLFSVINNASPFLKITLV